MSWLRGALERYRVVTNPLQTERRVELAAVLLAMVLCLQLLYSGARLALLAPPEAVAPAADALTVREIRSLSGLSSQQSDAIRARPLFWESRRPIATQVVKADAGAAKEKAGKMKDIKLLGVFGGGDTVGIIVRVKDKKRRVLVGEEIDGWTLQSADANEVVFTGGGRTQTLRLKAGQGFAAEEYKATDAARIYPEIEEESSSLGGMLRR